MSADVEGRLVGPARDEVCEEEREAPVFQGLAVRPALDRASSKRTCDDAAVIEAKHQAEGWRSRPDEGRGR